MLDWCRHSLMVSLLVIQEEGHQLRREEGIVKKWSDQKDEQLSRKVREWINLGNRRKFLGNPNDPLEVVVMNVNWISVKLGICFSPAMWYRYWVGKKLKLISVEVLSNWYDWRDRGETKLRVMTVTGLLKQSQSRKNVRKRVMQRTNVAVCQWQQRIENGATSYMSGSLCDAWNWEYRKNSAIANDNVFGLTI